VRRVLFLLFAALLAAGRAGGEEDGILLATTTSVRDSGLLDALLPDFEASTGLTVRALAVGSGAALRMGAEGNVDVLLTHAPSAEEALVASGVALARRPFMENHFVIAGPPEDPADVRGAGTAADAFARIAASGAPYASRADDSGTHRRERALFASAGLDPDAEFPGLVRTGAGMGLTLQVAGERRAYVLSDLGTFLAFRERVGLVSLSRESPDLRNVYSVLRIDPARFPGRVNARGAERFEAFLMDADTQRRIGRFGRERFGRPLFRPLHESPARD
jgi:tungstate transport system substrate-binding protein